MCMRPGSVGDRRWFVFVWPFVFVWREGRVFGSHLLHVVGRRRDWVDLCSLHSRRRYGFLSGDSVGRHANRNNRRRWGH